jgi:hypothetical protein
MAVWRLFTDLLCVNTMGQHKKHRGQAMRASAFVIIANVALVAGCSTVLDRGDSVRVSGVGQDDFLKLRFGPSLNYNAKLGLPDGTELLRRRCVTELGQLWCEVALANAPSVTGYVSADYIKER